jgi:purine nucleosidase
LFATARRLSTPAPADGNRRAFFTNRSPLKTELLRGRARIYRPTGKPWNPILPRRLIIDCDPGKDDAVALMVACASPELALEAVTTVAGNVGLERTTSNALAVLELCGRADVPVYPGCPRPILRPLRTAERVHGKSGIDGANLPPPRAAPRERHGVEALIDLVMAPGEPATIAALGPLTNVALAIVMEPRIVGRLAGIAVMGGALLGGNVTPAAEFNIHVDPHAAAVVFGCGAPVAVVPFDVTRHVRPGDALLDRLAASGRAAARCTVGMWRANADMLHDACVVAWLLRPDLFRSRPAAIAVVTEEGPDLGRTVEAPGSAPNLSWIEAADRDGVLELVERRIVRLD